jgi:hypothetical protein
MSIRSKLLITLIIFGAAAVAGIGYFNAPNGSCDESAHRHSAFAGLARGIVLPYPAQPLHDVERRRMFIAVMEEFRDAFRRSAVSLSPSPASVGRLLNPLAGWRLLTGQDEVAAPDLVPGWRLRFSAVAAQA